MNFFNPDSKFSQVMTSFGEMMLLNLCYIIGSLPIVTIGAANTAMYTIMGRRLREGGSGTIVPFFKAWWSNLKYGCLFWLAQVFVTVSMGMILFMAVMPTFLKVIAATLLVLATLTFTLIYPQLARFRNFPLAYIQNALILAVTKLRWVLLNLLLWLSPVILFLLFPVDFLRFGFIWILFGFSLLFFLSAELMQKILAPMEEAAASH